MNLKTINIISVLLPVAVILLFQIKLPGDFSYLPHIYTPINGLVFILLLVSFKAVKLGNVSLHVRLIKINMFLTILFLIMYILYHATTKETVFPEKGIMKILYYFILISHVLLSVIAIPLVLRSYYYGSINDLVKHRKIAKIAFSLWL